MSKKVSFADFQRILHNSKEYEMDYEFLTIRSYYDGTEVVLDLSKITPEMFEDMRSPHGVAAILEMCEERIEAWGARVERALGISDRNRCPIQMADPVLYSEIQDIIDEYEADHDEYENYTPDDVLDEF